MTETNKRKDMLRMMIKVRAFEEKLNELYQRKVPIGKAVVRKEGKDITIVTCGGMVLK